MARGELRERARGEGLGRISLSSFPKRPQPEWLAPCGDPNCAGCYEVLEILADGMEVHPRIHPPRSDY